MNKYNSFYDTVNQIVSYGIKKGILHLYTSCDAFKGTSIRLLNKTVVNFGSCSYLGLEFDERLKHAAKKAVDMYGTQFSESRAYVSLGLYEELQFLLEKIFEAPCVIAPTTTLAHIANIPIMVEGSHAVIMDQQVHNSVQTAVEIVKARAVPVELLRHNRIDLLEERVMALKDKHEKIWYMADGIYSMFGDHAPVEELVALMEKYPALHCYFDDAHGMSIYGKNGRGFVLGEKNIHPKMVIATSLNKAFASGGGLLVYGDEELAGKVSRAGGPLLSSGPMQPSGLGAAIAAAKIHLSDEITSMQDQLRQNIEYTHSLLKQYDLPVVSRSGAAILFVGVSLPKLGHNIVRRMLDAGFYVNLGIFPIVPIKQTGIRFTITRLHSFSEINAMISTLAKEFAAALIEEQVTIDDINQAFRRITKIEEVNHTSCTSQEIFLEHSKSISTIDKNIWDSVFNNKGTFDWEGLQLIEKSFTGNDKPEDNWLFDYLIVKDKEGKIIAATFITTGTWKDDMLSDSSISATLEERRRVDPYVFTSKVVCTGSLITEGEHFYIDRSNLLWKEAVKEMLQQLYRLKGIYKADHILLRDFKESNKELDSFMIDNGFFKINMPPTHIVTSMNWATDLEYYAELSKNSRDQLRKKVLKNSDLFSIEILCGPVAEIILEHMYELYLAVKNRSLELNTFALPIGYFKALLSSNDWEVIQLQLKDQSKPCCYVFCKKAASNYIPMIIGLNYEHNARFNIYRQALYQVMLRAKAVGAEKIFFGFSAGKEKQKMGACSFLTVAYMHTDDSYNMEQLMQMQRIN